MSTPPSPPLLYTTVVCLLRAPLRAPQLLPLPLAANTVDTFGSRCNGVIRNRKTALPLPLARFLNGFGVGEVPEAESLAEGLLNRSSLMDVPFRAMQRQHQLVYLAALEDPSPADGTVSDINMQSYAAIDTDTAGYLEEQEVRKCAFSAATIPIAE